MGKNLKAAKLLKERYKTATILIKNLGDGYFETVAIVDKKKVAAITERRGVILRRFIA